jgi:hypothetical protein
VYDSGTAQPGRSFCLVKRAILLSAGWLLAGVGLYMALVILELYWNLYNWQPIVDLRASGLILGVLALLAVIRWLARTTCDRVSQGLSLLICLALLAVAVYVFPPEPPTQGLFAREAPSPLWYRAARLVLLGLPSLFWALGLLPRWKRPARSDSRQDSPPSPGTSG